MPAEEEPRVTVPLALSDTKALPFAFAVTFVAFVVKGVAVELPSIFPFNEVRFKVFVKIVPVTAALCKSLNDVKLVVAIGVPALPIFPPIDKEPVCAVNETVAFGLAFVASIVPVVCKEDAFVAKKLKSVPADDVPRVTVPLALSEINALPAAFAVTLAALVKNGVTEELPSIFPFVDVRFKVFVNMVPVMLLLCRSLNEIRLVVPTGVVEFPMFAPTSSVPV